MKRKIESLKLKFAKELQILDYEFRYDYPRIEDCIQIIKIRDLLPSKINFEFFKFRDTERILIKANKRILIEYMILQNETRFELYELTISKWNEFERKVNESL